MVVFTLTALGLFTLQLVSYYCTSLKISGARLLKKTMFKAILDSCFTVLVFLLSFLYASYFSMVLVWFVLAALLNPEQFLAHGTAAITFFVFLVIKVTAFNKLTALIETNLTMQVSDQLTQLTQDSLLKASLVGRNFLSLRDKERLLLEKKALLSQIV